MRLGQKISEETRKKMSNSQKGRKLSEEHKKKLSLAKIDKKLSDEHKNNISLSLLNSNKNKGKIFTAEHREKIRKSLLGKKRSKESRLKTSNTLKLKYLDGTYIGSKGKHHSDETKRQISLSQKGKIISEETKLKISLANKGNFHSFKTKEKIKEKRSLQIFPINDTKIEIKIQDYLKQLNIEFYTHQYMNQIEHSYQCDIFIPSLNMVIECDGNYWHNYPVRREIDDIRTKELIEKGFKVLRLWESEIKTMSIKEFERRLS